MTCIQEDFMKRNMTIKSLAITAMAAVLAIGGPSAPAAAHAKSNGEIIGAVENGSKRVINAVVSLTEVPGTFSAPSKPVVMDQKNKEFEPHVLAVLKGTTVRFSNSDAYLHNVFSSSRVKAFNVSQAKLGDTTDVTFDKPGLIPIKCHIHANMKAYILVMSNPYFAVTNEKGLFQIGDVPAGTYTMKVWSDQGTADTQTVQVTAGGRAKAIFKVSQ
jgi:plastocyanin